MNLKRTLLGTSVALACIAAASAPLGAAAAPAAGWACGPYSVLGAFDAPGVGHLDTKNTAYPSGNSEVTITGSVTFLEVSPTQLRFESTSPVAGWTGVALKTGIPRIDVQSTNTAGGGGQPPNTIRLRAFFAINSANERIQQNYTVCHPAT